MAVKYFIVVHSPGASFALFNCESDSRGIDEACHFKGFVLQMFVRGEKEQAVPVPTHSLTELIIMN